MGHESSQWCIDYLSARLLKRIGCFHSDVDFGMTTHPRALPTPPTPPPTRPPVPTMLGVWLGSQLTWWKSLEVSGSHGGAKQQQRVFVVVGSCREPSGAVGSHWEPLGVVRSRGSQLRVTSQPKYLAHQPLVRVQILQVVVLG